MSFWGKFGSDGTEIATASITMPRNTISVQREPRSFSGGWKGACVVRETVRVTTSNHIVTTERLQLVPLPLDLLDAVLLGDWARARALAPFPLTAQTFAGDRYVLELRQAQLRADPTIEAWLYRVAVDRTTGQVVARIGFHAAPDAAATVEVGYSVQPEHRGLGLATEMATGLIAWAGQRGVRRVLASTAPTNLPSQAVIAKLGFVRTGEQLDEIDGLEWVYTLSLG